jgi:shikimate 5-dehydrogenase
LRYYGAEVTAYGRSPQKLKSLADRFDCFMQPWEQRLHRTGDVLINCTSVGMWPYHEVSPMTADALGGCRLVFDVIYNPLETRLLRDATAAGAKAVNGLDMFIRQAAVQFALWTSVEPDQALGRARITEALQEHASRS